MGSFVGALSSKPMMRTFSYTSWTLFLVLPLVFSGPVPSQNSCTSECRTPVNPKFQYEVGQTYTHTFETSTKTYVQATSNDQAILDVRGEALVTFRSSCEVSIELTKTSITGLDEPVDSTDLERFPMTFTYQDGSIESICSHPEDAAWVVNIKRAIVSMLQHSSQFLDVPENHVYESDVIGRCATKYTVEGTGKSVLVTKTKIPSQCSQRQGFESSIPTVAYNAPAEIQTVPVLNSSSTCHITIKDGVISSTICKESHLFRPLSSPLGGGARTDAISPITLIGKAPATTTTQTGAMIRGDLVVDHSANTEINNVRNTHTLSLIIDALCENMDTESPSRSSELFTELVHSMRTSSPEAIKAAYDNLLMKKDCKESKKIEMLFLDALPQAGSTASIELMSELLQNDKVS